MYTEDYEFERGHLWANNLVAGPLFRVPAAINALKFRTAGGQLLTLPNSDEYTSTVQLGDQITAGFTNHDVSTINNN